MTIARILAVNGRNVVTTQPHRTLTQVTEVLAERGIGAIIVTSADGEVLGILSERDIVRAVVHDGLAAFESSVSKYMTAKVVTTTEEMSVLSIMMSRGRFRHLPVVKHGRLVGLVSIGDVVKHRLEEIESERQALEDILRRREDRPLRWSGFSDQGAVQTKLRPLASRRLSRGFRRWPARRLASGSIQTAPGHYAPMLVHKLDWGTREDRSPETIEETFTYYRMPSQHHQHLKEHHYARAPECGNQATHLRGQTLPERREPRLARRSPSRPTNWVTGALPSASRESS
jgi:CBS domain-containing protein